MALSFETDFSHYISQALKLHKAAPVLGIYPDKRSVCDWLEDLIFYEDVRTTNSLVANFVPNPDKDILHLWAEKEPNEGFLDRAALPRTAIPFEELFSRLSLPSPWSNDNDFNRAPYCVDERIVRLLKGPLAENSQPGTGSNWNNHYTASTDGAALGINTYCSPHQQLLKLAGSPRAPKYNAFGQSNLNWGNEKEPLAIEKLQQHLRQPIFKVGFIEHPLYEWLGATPDGITCDGCLVEIKCPPKREPVRPKNEYDLTCMPFMNYAQVQVRVS